MKRIFSMLMALPIVLGVSAQMSNSELQRAIKSNVKVIATLRIQLDSLQAENQRLNKQLTSWEQIVRQEADQKRLATRSSLAAASLDSVGAQQIAAIYQRATNEECHSQPLSSYYQVARMVYSLYSGYNALENNEFLGLNFDTIQAHLLSSKQKIAFNAVAINIIDYRDIMTQLQKVFALIDKGQTVDENSTEVKDIRRIPYTSRLLDRYVGDPKAFKEERDLQRAYIRNEVAGTLRKQ